MSEKHRSPEWHRTCRIIRAQVKAAWARGDEVRCWRHGDLILPPEEGGAPWDVGHIVPLGGEAPDNAAPECRRGNRSHGGKIGAAITNGRRAAKAGRSTFKPPSWL